MFFLAVVKRTKQAIKGHLYGIFQKVQSAPGLGPALDVREQVVAHTAQAHSGPSSMSALINA